MSNRADDTSSQGLSSPPSANSPSQQNPPSADLAHFDTASRAVKFEPNDAKNGGLRTKKPGLVESVLATRKPRKKKEPDGQANHDGAASAAATSAITFGIDGKPKKPRAARGTSAAYQKKMQKRAEEEEEARRAAEVAALHAARAPMPEPHAQGSPLPPSNFGVPPTTGPPQNGNRDAIQNRITNYTQNMALQQQAQRPASGQNYDPIRSSTVAPRAASPMNISLSTPTKLAKHSSASASPSISSLIDLPNTMAPVTYSFPEYPKHGSDVRAATPPEAKRPRISPPENAPSFEQNRSATTSNVPYLTSNGPVPRTADLMDIDTDTTVVGPKPTTKKSSPNGSTAVSTASHSPKPSRATKEAPVALPSAGSGLLSGSIFGSSGLDSAAGSAPSAPTVVLDIPLTGESNQYINFSELAEKRYGFNALHPRLAAQRKRLADVAALGAAIEHSNKNGSGMSTDEKSVDLSNDEGEDSTVEMGGMNGPTKSGEDTGEPTTKPRKKRMMKEDMYDKDDGFVDDTELAWEEQAAVSKDGFFVYSGLLVPEGEEAKVERADGVPKRGGRGGGRGSRGGRGGGRGGASAASKDVAKDGKAPGRKPRTTKADKERMEREKAQRENLAPLASKPANYPMGPQIQV